MASDWFWRHRSSSGARIRLFCFTYAGSGASVSAIRPQLDLPFAMFGNSKGSVIAFEASSRLASEGFPTPLHVWMSASRAPGHSDPESPLRYLGEDAFVDALDRRFSGSADQRAPAERLDGWRVAMTDRFRVRVVDGDQFYLVPPRAEVLAEFNSELDPPGMDSERPASYCWLPEMTLPP